MQERKISLDQKSGPGIKLILCVVILLVLASASSAAITFALVKCSIDSNQNATTTAVTTNLSAEINKSRLFLDLLAPLD